MIKAGIIGLGYWGPNLLRNFAAHPNITVVCAADPRPQAREKARSQFPGVRYVAGAAEVLEDPAIDAVAIATPVETHYPLAREALERGKHVWVEKPLAESVDRARALVRTAEAAQRVLMVDHTFVYTAAVRKLRELIDQGQLGELYYYDSVRVNLGLFQGSISVLWDLAPHDISIMQYLFDRPVLWVQAVGARYAGHPHEAQAYLTIQFHGNVMGHLHVNWLAPAKIRRVVVGGSRRMCTYDENDASEKIKIYDKGVDITTPEGIQEARVQYRLGDVHSPALPTREALAEATAHFAQCILRGETPLTDGRAGLYVVEVLEAAERSMNRAGERIELQPVQRGGARHTRTAGAEDRRSGRAPTAMVLQA